jgi:hypothetical protein
MDESPRRTTFATISAKQVSSAGRAKPAPLPRVGDILQEAISLEAIGV